ncbi:MAG: hypothetical protein HY216_00305 [Candidatus Rokubacteria bacterium]|nr:hypothetical protein [Candidatus Rokubacteria bacterium]
MARKKKDPSEEIVQDNTREAFMAAYCGLTPSRKRTGTDVCDAAGNPFELKSTSSDSVSTARDVGLHTIASWRSKYWIVSVGSNFKGGWMTRELYIAHPADLEPWFADVEKKLKRDAEAGETLLRVARAGGVPDELLRRGDYLLKRGLTINNPHIPMKLIRERATSLKPNDPQAARKKVKAFIAKRPLGKAPSGQ